MTTKKGANRIFLLTIILYVLFSFLWPFVGERIGSPFYLDVVLTQTVVFLPALIYIRHTGMKVGELIPYKRISIKDGLLAIAMTYLCYPLLLVVNLITMFFVKNATAEMTGIMQEQNFLLNILFIAVLPACVEEFVFRGMLYHTYKRYHMLTGILLSAFLFGCMHMNFNQFLYTFVFGVVLALVLEATGSIVTSMICHFTLNATSVVMVKLLSLAGTQDMGSTAEQSSMLLEDPRMLLVGTLSWTVIAMFTTAGAFAIWIHLARKNGRIDIIRAKWEEPVREKCFSPALVIGVILSFVLMIVIEIWN